MTRKAAIALIILLAPLVSARARQQVQGPRFAFIDVFVDPRGGLLAAYQFELSVGQSQATIVGVEGGEHPAFNPAPYYDSAALSHGRIIIAAFSTGANLPNAKSRVARLHLRVTSTRPEYKVTLQTAGDASGRKLDNAIISFVDEKGSTP